MVEAPDAPGAARGRVEEAVAAGERGGREQLTMPWPHCPSSMPPPHIHTERRGHGPARASASAAAMAHGPPVRERRGEGGGEREGGAVAAEGDATAAER